MNTKPTSVSLVIFIDALGWEVLKGRSFLERELPYRRKLRSVFGFSSACIPSILTGLDPREHTHWSFFYYSPETSPFKMLRLLALSPGRFFDRGRVRRILSRLVQRLFGFTGYFQIYNIPLNHADRFDYCEKKDLFRAGNMNRGANIFEYLDNGKITYHLSNWRDSEDRNLDALKDDLEAGQMTFGFVYLAAMDGLLHRVGKNSRKVDEKLAWYESRLKDVFAAAHENYDELRVFLCSDHGMATIHTHVDLMAEIEQLDLAYAQDYIAIYDSTMARFWFMTDTAKTDIIALLKTIRNGRILARTELRYLGCDFDNNQYGELVFLMDPGVLILPSHMGLKPVAGMHGYHPDHEDSDAALLSNVPPETDPQNIKDIFWLMRAEAGV